MTALLIVVAVLWDRPGIDGLTVPKADRRELREVLQKWEQAIAGTAVLRVRFDQYRYSAAHKIETRGAGKLLYVATESAAYVIDPVRVHGIQPQREGWRLEPARADYWEWNESEVQCRLGNGPTDRYVLPLVEPPELWPSGFRQWIETPGGFLRPFLANFSGNAMRWRYRMRMGKSPRTDEIRVEFTPWVRRDIEQVECLLDARTYQPRAIRIVEIDEVSTVYTIRQIQAN
jgi:hypothetical protein